jgi:hypothetical protein
MKKIILTAALCSFSLLSFAGGPDQMNSDNNLSGLSIGIQGGLSASTLSYLNNYNGDDGVGTFYTSQLTTSATTYAGLYGANLAWGRRIRSNFYSVVFSYNRLTSTNIASIIYPAPATAAAADLLIQENIRLKNQYNLGFIMKHYFTPSFDILAGLGATTLSFHDAYLAHDPGNNTLLAGNDSNGYLYGAYFELGGEYFVSKRMSINGAMYYFTYKNKSLKSLSNNEAFSVQTGNGEMRRKALFSIPAVLFGFNYYI